MLTKNQAGIVEMFRKDLFFETTIRGLMGHLQKKSYQRVHDAVTGLVEEGILGCRVLGKSRVCRIMLSNKSISTLAYLEELQAHVRKIPAVEEILALDDFADDIVIVAGSYAKGLQTKRSDVDVVIITKDDAFHKLKMLENRSLLLFPRVHPLVFSYADFVRMLCDKGENFGKEVFRHRLVYRNAERFFSLIREAMEHGFNGGVVPGTG